METTHKISGVLGAKCGEAGPRVRHTVASQTRILILTYAGYIGMVLVLVLSGSRSDLS